MDRKHIGHRWRPLLEAYISVRDSFTQGENICDTLVAATAAS